MICCVDGIILRKRADEIVVGCGGVGFRVAVPAGVPSAVGDTGEKVFLFTHLQVKDDGFELYGFISEDELNCFKMLIGVSGVGPRSALSILSVYKPDRIALAVASGDYRAFVACSGIGQKLAQRIVLELKGKLAGFGSGEASSVAAADVGTGSRAEAMAALCSLGFTASEASLALMKLPDDLSAEELISRALKSLAVR